MPESDADLAFTPATELLTLISNGEVSSTELTELYLARIEELDPQLNAYVTVTPELALEQAAKADEATARGETLGPLHGLPVSLKDLQMTKGVRTTGGSLAYKDRVPDANGTSVQRILDAGAVILGKTNSPEFGHLGATENRLGKSCWNPWNPERTSAVRAVGQRPPLLLVSARWRQAETAEDPFEFQRVSVAPMASNRRRVEYPAIRASTGLPRSICWPNRDRYRGPSQIPQCCFRLCRATILTTSDRCGHRFRTSWPLSNETSQD